MGTARRYLGGVLLAGLVAAAPAAQAQGLDDLRYRVATLEAELAALRARAGGGSGTLLERLDRLEEEIRELTGEVEELSFRQRQIAEDAQRRFGDIEFRLTELEGGDVAAVSEPPPLGGVGEEPGAEPDAAVSVSEREALDMAIEDVNQGRYDQADDRLQRFLNTYGQSPLRAEALFWLGESQFIQGDFRGAARSFLDSYNASATGEAAPKSLYRLGVTLGRLGQRGEACLTLREVATQFPSAPGTLLDDAEAESDRLGCV